MVQSTARKVIATNRRARHDYSIEETYEVGLELVGTEVKSLRVGKANIREGFARIANGEVWLHNVHISPYDHGNRWNHEPTRPRRVLMHKKEIRRLIGKIQQQGFTLVPLSLYFTDKGIAKMELGLAKGKKKWDKRESIAKRSAQREVERATKVRMIK